MATFKTHPIPASMASLFEPTEKEAAKLNGAVLRNLGMDAAVDHAEKEIEGWKGEALRFLKKFIGYTKGKFMAEDVRLASLNGGVPEPPSKRAWGWVIMQAAKNGWINKVGYREVSNPKAHKTPAAVWKRASTISG